MNTFETPIAVRAYTEPEHHTPLGTKPWSDGPEASPWTLTFDCETTIDEVQQLRFGFYQVREADDLVDEGVFYSPEGVSHEEIEQLIEYTQVNQLQCVTVATFNSAILLKYGFTRCGTIVGFNLPFDISRIAIRHSPARGTMRGGFSFELTPYSDDPRIRVKHLSPRAALIDFAKPGDQEAGRSVRKRGGYVPSFRGHFVDLKTLSAALRSRRYSLATLAEELCTPTQKQETDEHGLLTEAYLGYARTDVQATWECYVALRAQYAEHGLSQPIDRILSEASIGKAYLRQMGIRPFLGVNPDFPRELMGQIFCAYYGGRAEVRMRKSICEVIYTDFKSMYPTVNALMQLWQFVIADSISYRNSTDEIKALLNSVSIEDFQKPDQWRELATIARVRPNDDLLPVRAKYDPHKTNSTYTIGLNYLTYDGALWFTLADLITSKTLTGKSPEIIEARTFEPGSAQADLSSVSILGRDEFTIDPNREDLFTRLIDLRDDAKSNGDSIEKALKIIANATSYGIFIEVNRDDAPKSEPLCVFGPDATSQQIKTTCIETPGRYFHGLLGVLITGAARLMLALAEAKVREFGLDWAFCDTDSLAIVRPKSLSRRTFQARVSRVIDWFAPLNPYQKLGSILKIEDINYASENRENMRPLYCYAISAKRYALFNLDKNNRPIIRKASAHGLGHLLPPYSDKDVPQEFIAPQFPLHEIGVSRWQHDFWVQIIEAALHGHPNQVNDHWHPAMSEPAAMRYTASSPQLLKWLDHWNEGMPYHEQIRPFGFMLSLPAKTGVLCPPQIESVVDEVKRGRPKKIQVVKPIAPFRSQVQDSAPLVFDRVTGELLDAETIKTYTECLMQYHLSAEAKFDNADYFDIGPTERRHVVATRVTLIGKEANRVGENGEEDPTRSKVACYDKS